MLRQTLAHLSSISHDSDDDELLFPITTVIQQQVELGIVARGGSKFPKRYRRHTAKHNARNSYLQRRLKATKRRKWARKTPVSSATAGSQVVHLLSTEVCPWVHIMWHGITGSWLVCSKHFSIQQSWESRWVAQVTSLEQFVTYFVTITWAVMAVVRWREPMASSKAQSLLSTITTTHQNEGLWAIKLRRTSSCRNEASLEQLHT